MSSASSIHGRSNSALEQAASAARPWLKRIECWPILGVGQGRSPGRRCSPRALGVMTWRLAPRRPRTHGESHCLP